SYLAISSGGCSRMGVSSQRQELTSKSGLRMPRSGRLSLASTLSLALLVLVPSCSAQEDKKPEAPRAQRPVEEDIKGLDAQAPYRPMTGKARVRWTLRQTFGRESLAFGAVKAGLATARDWPPEYGPHWDGFGKRYGMRFTGIAASNTIEAGLGAIW